MAKVRTHYVCQSCGATAQRWLGKCPSCDEWNSLVEEKVESTASAAAAPVKGSYSERLGVGVSRGHGYVSLEQELEGDEGASVGRRYTSGIGELDRVLGGGIVRDGFVLLGGDPGVGKSTLLLQMVHGAVKNQKDLKVLYVSGEESVEQIQSRARRLGVRGDGRLFLEAETQFEQVLASVRELKPNLLVLDSLQTFVSNQLESAPGSVSQVREIAARLMHLAKSSGLAVWIIGHVTKDGQIAGPKVVEHMVDTVLYFENEAGQSYRLIRAVKNRFGSARELGVFEMEGEGLKEVTNPSALFLSERATPVAGTAVVATLEGTRPLLVEVQALLCETTLTIPRRTAVGFDGNRLALIAAILQRHAGLTLQKEDLFFNVAGGLKLIEPACDLAAAAAIWSSAQNRAFAQDIAFFGELGLTGEVRKVAYPEVRIEEAKKLGFKAFVLPKGSEARLTKSAGIEVIPIQRLEELERLL